VPAKNLPLLAACPPAQAGTWRPSQHCRGGKHCLAATYIAATHITALVLGSSGAYRATPRSQEVSDDHRP
jgi:hypothetical protein